MAVKVFKEGCQKIIIQNVNFSKIGFEHPSPPQNVNLFTTI